VLRQSLEPNVPLYFFDVIDHLKLTDDVGIELATFDAAKFEAIRLAGEILVHADPSLVENLTDWKIRIRDETGSARFEVGFTVSESYGPQQARSKEDDDLIRRFDDVMRRGREIMGRRPGIGSKRGS
jgi:hypothetical protein